VSNLVQIDLSNFVRLFSKIVLDWIGLDWIGLDWIGLDWIGLDWIGLDWIGLDWICWKSCKERQYIKN